MLLKNKQYDFFFLPDSKLEFPVSKVKLNFNKDSSKK